MNFSCPNIETRVTPEMKTPDTLSSRSNVYPLDEFYAQAGHDLPRIDLIPATEVPKPFRQLLVHESDMTSTLERFHGERIHLQLFRRQEAGSFYFREVALILDRRQIPVEFGAIKIALSLFPEPARELIREGRLPLGRILADCNVTYSSQPQAFLRLGADPFMSSVLRLSGAPLLYGRRNTLVDASGRSLAEIVEILPPVAPVSGTGHS